MADTNKATFLGSINPWGGRSSTPPPKSPKQVPTQTPKEDKNALKPSLGGDHSSNNRPTPSSRRYPKDCPLLKTRWYYAVDLAKRKPFAPELPPDDKEGIKKAPKKWLLFSEGDSKAIENAFQQLGKDDEFGEHQTATKVPVNEDYLYDVHVEKRELEPAYWIGPVYDVRRGSWFYQDQTPCEENLANQLEEGYLKLTPWRKFGAPRSASQPRSRSSTNETDPSPGPGGEPSSQTTERAISNTYRLFGSHMNTTATYYDATTAYLSSDDFMSRMSSTVYGSFGGPIGMRVNRGYSIPSVLPKATDTKEKRKSKLSETANASDPDPESSETKPAPSRPSALERQLSSLAGLTRSKTSDEEQKDEQEEARVEEQREMEDAREKDGEDQAREIDHLVLVTHGIGQRLGLRLDSINFVHDVNTMRKTMKAVYEASPDLHALAGDSKNCRVQVLPVCWRHLLDFPKQSLKQNREEYDLGDLDTTIEDEYPSLQDITVDGVPAVRNLITDLALDVLLYQSAYREHISRIVRAEVNRVHRLFCERTQFKGKVSLCGHSLGSAVFFDILCRQGEEIKTRPQRTSSKTTREFLPPDGDIALDFPCENFFALGSPIALFQMLKGRTIAGRPVLQDRAPPTSPFDSDPMQNNPFQSLGDTTSENQRKALVPITTSSPKCAELYNIFHPTDPIAYRIEPLISPAMKVLKSQALPYTKSGLFAAPGMANLTARLGQSVMSSWYNLTSGVASTLINRSLGITGEEQALPQDRTKIIPQQAATTDRSKPVQMPPPPVTDIVTSSKQKAIAKDAKTGNKSSSDEVPTLIDNDMETLYAGFQRRRRSHASTASVEPSDLEYEIEQAQARRLKKEEYKVRALNSNGRVDYHIQEGMFDVSLLASIASHLSYWADADVNHFMIGQMLKAKNKQQKRDEDRDKVVV